MWFYQSSETSLTVLPGVTIRNAVFHNTTLDSFFAFFFSR